jgi:hypothetical protein
MSDAADDIQVDSRTDEELDALADNNTASNKERAMSEEPVKEAPAQKEDYEFVHNGKPIKATRDQIIKWAQMGYDRPQFAQKLNQEKAQWLQEKTQFEQLRSKYKPYEEIDQWASKNPDQWQRLEALWKQNQNPSYQASQNPESVGNAGGEFQPYISKIQLLEEKLGKFEPIVSQIMEREQEAKIKEEDSKLDQEIRSIQTQYKDLDWNSLDAEGKTLETRILEHAQTSRIPTFRAAMRDLLHDDLMNRGQAQAKLSVAKGIQSRTKLGVLGESPTSQRGRESNTRNIRETSYEDLERDIREELRRGAS